MVNYLGRFLFYIFIVSLLIVSVIGAAFLCVILIDWLGGWAILIGIVVATAAILAVDDK